MSSLSIWLLYSHLFKKNSWSKFVHLCFILCFFSLVELYPSSLGWVSLSYNLSSDYLSGLILILVPLVHGLSVLSEGGNFYLKKLTPDLTFSLGMLMMALLWSFSCSNLLGFYMGFEASMIVMVYIILNWGSERARFTAGGYMAGYAIFSSMPFLWCLAILHSWNHDTSMLLPLEVPQLPSGTSLLFGVGLCLTFLVKSPLYPFHLWLPKAHVEAPTCASMVLAGVMLKLGTYGLFRVTDLFFKEVSFLTPFVVTIGVWGSVITSIICLRLVDLKEVVAYASVGHMGLVCAAVFVGSSWGMSGALCMLMAHGLISSLLFASIGFMSGKTGSRSVLLNKGFMKAYPHLSPIVFLACACNMAAPPFISFLAEVGIVGSLGAYHWLNFILLGISSFMTGAYSLKFYLSTQHGPTHPLMRPSSISWDGPAYLSMILHCLYISSMSLMPHLFM
nr:NADH dehydrogenase subunit 4 [Glottidia pyramidata]